MATEGKRLSGLEALRAAAEKQTKAVAKPRQSELDSLKSRDGGLAAAYAGIGKVLDNMIEAQKDRNESNKKRVIRLAWSYLRYLRAAAHRYGPGISVILIPELKNVVYRMSEIAQELGADNPEVRRLNDSLAHLVTRELPKLGFAQKDIDGIVDYARVELIPAFEEKSR